MSTFSGIWQQVANVLAPIQQQGRLAEEEVALVVRLQALACLIVSAQCSYKVGRIDTLLYSIQDLFSSYGKVRVVMIPKPGDLMVTFSVLKTASSSSLFHFFFHLKNHACWQATPLICKSTLDLYIGYSNSAVGWHVYFLRAILNEQCRLWVQCLLEQTLGLSGYKRSDLIVQCSGAQLLTCVLDEAPVVTGWNLWHGWSVASNLAQWVSSLTCAADPFHSPPCSPFLLLYGRFYFLFLFLLPLSPWQVLLTRGKLPFSPLPPLLPHWCAGTCNSAAPWTTIPKGWISFV